MTPASPARIAGLDGIRAVAVILVFCFHAGFSWARGGFLGVSVFFTLSGFVITRLLLEDCRQRRTIRVMAFWGARARRLLPAALIAVAFVLLLSTMGMITSSTLGADALAALAQVANWRFLLAGQSYAGLFQEPSPLLHFWSLAIEQQFYVFFPLTFAVVLRRSGIRRLRRVMSRASAAGVGASVAIAIVAGSLGAFDFAYYSLPTRVGEVLVGALLACSGIPQRLIGSRSPLSTWVAGWCALVAVVILAATVDPSARWISFGGLILFAGVSVILIAAALPYDGVATFLSWSPLQALGRISYGVYLFHWPIILWLDREQVGVGGVALALIQAAVTILVATVSFVVIEEPIRQRRWPVPGSGRLAGALAVAVVVVPIVAFSSMFAGRKTNDVEMARDVLAAAVSRPAGSAPSGASTTPVSVAFFGDSTALWTAVGVAEWTKTHSDINFVAGETWLGCGLTRSGEVRYQGATTAARRLCPDWAQVWPEQVSSSRPTAAVIQVGPFDVADRRLSPEDAWRAPGDPIYDDYLEQEMLAAVDLFLARGITPIWLTSPRIDADRILQPRPAVADPASDPARMDRFNAILRSVQAQRPGLQVIDLAAWLRSQPGGELDPALRPDGVHLTLPSARIVAAWLAPAIVRAARAESSVERGSPGL